MGHFSNGLSFLWSGRSSEDSFALTLSKSNPLQKAYMKNGTTAVLLSPAKEDSASLTVSFGIGDSGKVVFLAAPKSDLAISPGIPKTPHALLPDFLRIGNNRLAWGPDALSGRLLLTDAQGRKHLDRSVSRPTASVPLSSVQGFLYGSWSVESRSGSVRITPLAFKNGSR
jgi:hypothetical protein